MKRSPLSPNSLSFPSSSEQIRQWNHQQTRGLRKWPCSYEVFELLPSLRRQSRLNIPDRWVTVILNLGSKWSPVPQTICEITDDQETKIKSVFFLTSKTWQRREQRRDTTSPVINVFIEIENKMIYLHFSIVKHHYITRCAALMTSHDVLLHFYAVSQLTSRE